MIITHSPSQYPQYRIFYFIFYKRDGEKRGRGRWRGREGRKREKQKGDEGGEREIVKSYRKNNPKNSHVFIKDFFML